MTHLLFLPLLLASGLPYRWVQQCTGMESPATYEITITAVLTILPTPIRTFLETNLTEFHDLVVADVVAEIGVQRRGSDRLRHFIELDIDTPVVDVGQRRAAVARFPRDKEKAKELFQRHAPHRGGMLPWVIEECYADLRRAFQSGDGQQTLRAAAELLHFSADAAMPPQVSACCFSAESCSDQLNDQETVEMHRRDYHRTFTAFQEVLAFEVRVHPDWLTPSNRPLQEAFETATRAYGILEQIMASELDCGEKRIAQLSEAQVQNRCGVDGRGWPGLPTTALPYLKMQVESGALLAANLIAGAWEEAGRPQLKAAASVPPPGVVPIPHDVAVLYVGSRNSTVYHHPTCAHAPRIKLENRVTFESQELARAAGRTPCKTCKPDSPNKPPPR